MDGWYLIPTGKTFFNETNGTEWHSYLISSSGLKQLVSGSQADSCWSRARSSLKGLLLPAGSGLVEVLDVTASCFTTAAVSWRTSSAWCIATCLWMLLRSVNSCWQHVHHFSLHSQGGAGTSLVLTKTANACNYISNMSLVNNLRF